MPVQRLNHAVRYVRDAGRNAPLGLAAEKARYGGSTRGGVGVSVAAAG